MSSGGADPKVATQAPNQDGEGESSEQLTQFVSDSLTLIIVYGKNRGKS